jgi:hypothetical protein
VVLIAWVVTQSQLPARRALITALGGGAAISIVGQEAFRRAYYHAWLPNTYALKLGGVTFGDRFTRGGWVLAYQLAAAAALAIVATWWAWRCSLQHQQTRSVLTLLVALAAAAAGYCLYVGGDAWEWMRYADRYLTPGLVMLLIAASIGVGALAEHRPPRRVALGMVVATAFLAAIAAAGILPSGTHVIGLDPETVIPVLLLLAPAGFAFRLLGNDGAAPGRTIAIGCAIAIALQVSGPAFGWWAAHNAVYADFDADHSRFATTLSAITRPGARIAVTVAGSEIYFSHRDGIDILGKMDARIAAEPIHPGWFFFPGHMKWDYAVTVSERPDVLADWWGLTAPDLARLRAAGYSPMQVRPEVAARLGLVKGRDKEIVLVSAGSHLVERSLLVPAPWPPVRTIASH